MLKMRYTLSRRVYYLFLSLAHRRRGEFTMRDPSPSNTIGWYAGTTASRQDHRTIRL